MESAVEADFQPKREKKNTRSQPSQVQPCKPLRPLLFSRHGLMSDRVCVSVECVKQAQRPLADKQRLTNPGKDCRAGLPYIVFELSSCCYPSAAMINQGQKDFRTIPKSRMERMITN